MKTSNLIYIHGGEAFDSYWEGLKSFWQEGVIKKGAFWKSRNQKWPDTLVGNLPDFEVLKLQMPAKYNAKYQAWVKHFESQFEAFDDEVTLLGWSLGAIFLAKYLAENDFPKTLKSVHLVAGCYGLGGGFELPNDFPAKLADCPVTLYHSRDDFVVDFTDFKQYQQALPKAKTLIFEDRNHFLQPEFPELISRLKKS
jgi:predicted alpha/beta hydrolase family esterase